MRRMLVVMLAVLQLGAAEGHPLEHVAPAQPPEFSTEAAPTNLDSRAATERALAAEGSPPVRHRRVTGFSEGLPAAKLSFTPGERLVSLDGKPLSGTNWAALRTGEAGQILVLRGLDGRERSLTLPKGQLGLLTCEAVDLRGMLSRLPRDARWDDLLATASAAWETDPDRALAACKGAADAGYGTRPELHLLAALACAQAHRWEACLDHGSLALADCPPEVLPVLAGRMFTAAVAGGYALSALQLLDRYPTQLAEVASLREALTRMRDRFSHRRRPPAPSAVTANWVADSLLRRCGESMPTDNPVLNHLAEGDVRCCHDGTVGVMKPGATTLRTTLAVWMRPQAGEDLDYSAFNFLKESVGLSFSGPLLSSNAWNTPIMDLGVQVHPWGVMLRLRDETIAIPGTSALSATNPTTLDILIHEDWCQISFAGSLIYDGPTLNPPQPWEITFGYVGHCHLFASIDELLPSVAMDRRLAENPDACGRSGRTFLHNAAAFARSDDVRRALAAKAAVDLGDVHGRTALHLAAGHDAAEAVRLLIEAKAGISLADHDGLTPLDLAYANECPAAAALLETAGATATKPKPPAKSPEARKLLQGSLPEPPAPPPEAKRPRKPAKPAAPPTPRLADALNDF